MANEFDRDLTDLRAVSIDEVESAGILGIEELPQFRASINSNFSGEQKQVLTEIADSIEAGEGIPKSAIDPEQRAREPEPGNPESIRKRLTGQEGTPSDEYGYKTEDDARFDELISSNDIETNREDDGFIQVANEETGTPLTQEQVFMTGDRVSKAEEYNQTERTQRERSVDEEYNAPVTTDYDRWKENPDRLDFPGVDTIPKDRRQERAATFAAQAQEQGFVDTFEIGTGLFGEQSPGTAGNAAGSTVEVDTSRAFNSEQVLAHEVGHKVEEQLRGTDSGLFPTEAAAEDATTLSTQLRGEPDDPYRESDSERFADAIAATVLDPRRAKRDAPEFIESLQERLPEEQREIFPF